MRSARVLVVVLATLLVAAVATRALAFPPSHTTATVGDVTLEGVANRSSVTVRREPEVTLTNGGAQPHVVELLELTSIGDGSALALVADGPTSRTLAPHEHASWDVAFHGGVPIESGMGLPYRRFQLAFRVDGARVTVIASNAYMCRIPVRHSP